MLLLVGSSTYTGFLHRFPRKAFYCILFSVVFLLHGQQSDPHKKNNDPHEPILQVLYKTAVALGWTHTLQFFREGTLSLQQVQERPLTGVGKVLEKSQRSPDPI